MKYAEIRPRAKDLENCEQILYWDFMGIHRTPEDSEGLKSVVSPLKEARGAGRDATRRIVSTGYILRKFLVLKKHCKDYRMT